MKTAYIIIDSNGHRRIGGCESQEKLDAIVSAYPEYPTSVESFQIPQCEFDAWRDLQDKP